MPGELRVAVAGGGIGGLVLAIALDAHGVEVAVFEQAGEHREIGAGVALSGNATRLLHRLGLEEALAAVATEPSALVFRRWDDGRVIADHPVGRGGWYRGEVGAPYYGVHRVDLLRVLTEALPPGVLRLGRRAAGVRREDGEAVLELEDGEPAAAHVVAGADGVHSVLRRHVAGADAPAVFSGTVGYRGLVPVGDLPSLPDATPLQFWAGPGRHLLHYSISGGRVVNFLAVVRQARWTAETWSEPCPVQDAVDAFAGWHPAVTEMVGAIAEMTRWALHDHAPLERWSAGRVTLLGDAAHSMLPFLAQGAVMAIEDGYVLARCLREFPVEEALERYEGARRERTRRTVEGSSANMHRFHNRALADPVEGRKFIDREWASQRIAERYEWLFRYDATTVEV